MGYQITTAITTNKIIAGVVGPDSVGSQVRLAFGTNSRNGAELETLFKRWLLNQSRAAWHVNAPFRLISRSARVRPDFGGIVRLLMVLPPGLARGLALNQETDQLSTDFFPHL